MKEMHSIQAELKALNSLLPVVPQPFTVPDGYFEGLAGAVLLKIRAMEGTAADEIAHISPLLAGLSRQMPNEVPAGFFTSSLEGLKALTETDDSALLHTISKQMPYTVPNGYFEQLPAAIVGRTAQPKVIPMVRRRWMKLAVAAAVAGLMALAGYFYLAGNNAATDTPLAGQLKNVSTTELEEFIKNTTFANSQTASHNRAKPVNVEQMLNDVSDKELDAFLKGIPAGEDDLFAIN